MVYAEDYEFEIGRAIQLRDGDAATPDRHRPDGHRALEAAQLLHQQGIECAVLDMHTIKPIDHQAIEVACRNSSLLVTLEEHSVIGGLGSAVAEVASGLKHAPQQLTLGLQDRFGKANDQETILEQGRPERNTDRRAGSNNAAATAITHRLCNKASRTTRRSDPGMQ